MTLGMGGHQPFGLGNIFRSPAVPATVSSISKKAAEDGSTSTLPKIPGMEGLAAALASTKLSDESNPLPWPTSPAYTPIYILTSSEYVVQEAKPRIEPSASTSGDASDWISEAYESTAGDVVFQRFVGRVRNEGQQCVRYVSKAVAIHPKLSDVDLHQIRFIGRPVALSSGCRLRTVVSKGRKEYDEGYVSKRCSWRAFLRLPIDPRVSSVRMPQSL